MIGLAGSERNSTICLAVLTSDRQADRRTELPQQYRALPTSRTNS